MHFSNTEPASTSVVPANAPLDEASHFAMGLALAGAAIGRCGFVQTSDGMVYHPGLNMIIVTENGAGFLSAFQPLLTRFRYLQAKRHRAMADLDPEDHQRAITAVKRERLAFEQSDPMAASQDLAFFDQQLLELKNVARPMQMLEDPPPGRVTLALGKSADSTLLAVYDSLATQGLLNASRLPRGSLDFEAMTKSSMQQCFDGGYLEGVLDVGIPTPTITSVMMATPEQAAAMLLANDPIVAAFADTCLFISGESEGTPGATGITLPGPRDWLRHVSRLLAPRDGGTRIVRIGNDAAQVLAEFGRKLVAEHENVPVEHRRFMHHISRQAVRMALVLHMLEEMPGNEITGDKLNQAVDFILLSVGHRVALLQAAVARDTESFRNRVVDIVKRAKVPTAPRDLCRHMSNIRIKDVMPVLDELVKGGTLEEKKGRYLIPSAVQLQVAAG